MKLSIVATMYRSESYIEEFYDRISTAANSAVGNDYEIILVDDGSPDDSFNVASSMVKKDSRVKVVELSRNFGHHKAMMTGLNYASGDLVFLIDIDLEEEPELLLSFLAQMKSNHCDVVYGVQSKRKGGLFERISGKIAYKIYDLLLDVKLPSNIVTARLMTIDYVKALLQHPEKELCISGLWEITGFRQQQQTIKKHSHSETTYSFYSKVKLMVDAITSFSAKPLKLIFTAGMLITLLSFIYLFFIIFQWAFLNNPPSGWTSLICSIWLIGGLNFLFLGTVGVYLSKIFAEVKARPRTIIRQVVLNKECDPNNEESV